MTPRTRRDRRALRLTYLLLAMLPIAALFSAKAHADPVQDSAYIDTLDHFGVYYSSEAAAINVAYGICGAFDRGNTFNDVIRTALRAGFDPMDAAHEIGAAIGVYCPEHLDVIPTTSGRLV